MNVPTKIRKKYSCIIIWEQVLDFNDSDPSRPEIIIPE